MINTTKYYSIINEIRKTIKPYFAEKIYHYTSPNGFLGIMDNNPSLFFTQYDSLNDTKERIDLLDTLNMYCDELKKQKVSDKFLCDIKKINLTDDYLISYFDDSECKEHVFSTFTKRDECYSYICSFSYMPDLLPMWRMYSKEEHYEGYCIGICPNTLSLFDGIQKGYSARIVKVIYSYEEKRDILNKIILPLTIDYEKLDYEERQYRMSLIKYLLKECEFVFKNESFEYEKEIRIILHIPKESSKNDLYSCRKFRTFNGMLIPYVEIFLNKGDFIDVCVAPSLKKEIAINNLKNYLELNGYSHVKTYESKVPIRVI